MSTDTTKQTEATLGHHLQAFGEGSIDSILSDYTEDSVLFTADGPVHGLDELRPFFETFMQNLPPGLVEALEIVRQDVEGEIAYIVWQAEPFVSLGTDTFVVRDGKIVVQTFAAYMPS